MNVDIVNRNLDRYGSDVTFRRYTGTQRTPFLVKCRVQILTGTANLLVGAVEQTADEILMTNRELDAAGVRGVPRQGDEIVYADGRSTRVQGRAKVTPLDDGAELWVFNTVGG